MPLREQPPVGGAVGDTTSVQETLPAAGYAVAEQISTTTAQGQYKVHEQGMCEVVTDKGYHSGTSLVEMREMGVRSYQGPPQRRAPMVGNAAACSNTRLATLLRPRTCTLSQCAGLILMSEGALHRQALPGWEIVHNAVWFADEPAFTSDPYVQQEIQAANYINLMRGEPFTCFAASVI